MFGNYAAINIIVPVLLPPFLLYTIHPSSSCLFYKVTKPKPCLSWESAGIKLVFIKNIKSISLKVSYLSMLLEMDFQPHIAVILDQNKHHLMSSHRITQFSVTEHHRNSTDDCMKLLIVHD